MLNNARITKAALQKCHWESSLNVNQVCPVCPVCPVCSLCPVYPICPICPISPVCPVNPPEWSIIKYSFAQAARKVCRATRAAKEIKRRKMHIICAKLGGMAKYVMFFTFFLCSKSSDAPDCESGMKPRFCPFCISFSGSHSIFMVIVVVLFLAHFFICSQEEVQSSFLCNVCVLSQFQIGSSTCLLCVYIVKT